MARRKQHQARQRERPAGSAAPPKESRETQLPPPNPPKRSLPLLWFSIGLFLIWLVVLIVLAVSV